MICRIETPFLIYIYKFKLQGGLFKMIFFILMASQYSLKYGCSLLGGTEVLQSTRPQKAPSTKVNTTRNIWTYYYYEGCPI